MIRQAKSSNPALLDRASTGLGIGLTLVRTLTEMHGGSGSASSGGLGQGSEFVVRLPMEASREVAVEAPVPLDAVVAPLRILVVDDNHDAADSLAMLLTMNGPETHVEHDGAAAVEAAAAFRPDVLLMDFGLPGLNGYEAARRFDVHVVKPMDYVTLGRMLAEYGAHAHLR